MATMAIATTYRYNPVDFMKMKRMPEDLSGFYSRLEEYSSVPTDENLWHLRNQWEILFFTIKHREVAGFLNPAQADEMRKYLEELVNERVK